MGFVYMLKSKKKINKNTLVIVEAISIVFSQLYNFEMNMPKKNKKREYKINMNGNWMKPRLAIKTKTR